MNIKSLLLGSAAAMVAVSSAQAADAVVVEAEPVEYVRVCDAYGSGFFFIPGTETCIRFGGFVRTSYEKVYTDVTDSLSGAAAISDSGIARNDDSAGNFATRLRLNIDTRNETDWGTLRALLRLEAGSANDLARGAGTNADVALISLAGFRLGQNGANYWSTNHGFAGVNLEGVGSNADGQSDDGWYGFRDSQVFDYTFAADGLSITVGVEDVRGGNSSGGSPADLNGTFASDGGTGFINYYAGLNYSADFGTIAFTAVHDSNAIEIDSGTLATSTDFGDGGFAYKASLSLDISEFVPGGILYGSYQYDGDYQTDYVETLGALQNAESIIQLGFQANLTDEFEFIVSYNYAEGGNTITGTAGNAAVLQNVSEGDADLLAIGLNWYPAAAPGFHVKSSYYFGEVDNGAGGAFATVANPLVDTDFDAFVISVRRDF